MEFNWKKFDKELKEESEDILVRQFILFHRKVALYVFQQVMRRSPVWTGRYRASHRIAINIADEKVAPEHPNIANLEWPEPVSGKIAASMSMSDAALALNALKPFDRVVISNNLSYAKSIEHGSSQQAPLGVYALALVDAANRFAHVKVVE